jgi:hypothetical protein
MANLTDICNQRKQFMLFNIPPVRFEPQNPYNGTNAPTQYQLNMRRKVEILKYNKNSTQGPRQTKRERTAAALSGRTNLARTVCPDDYKIPVISTAAGIPGPAIYLVEDRSVPLYNYVKNTNAYAEQNDEDDNQWVISSNSNQQCVDNNLFTRIAKLIIRPSIQQPYTTFTYRTPVIFRLKGSGLHTNDGKTANGERANIVVNVDSINFQATYNNASVSNQTTLTTRFISNTSISVLLSATPTTYETENSTFDYFCETYIGYLEISDIGLTTNPGGVYDFNIQYITSKTTTSSVTNQLDFLENKNIFEFYTNVTALGLSIDNANKDDGDGAIIDSTYKLVTPVNCELLSSTNPDTVIKIVQIPEDANVEFTSSTTIT